MNTLDILVYILAVLFIVILALDLLGRLINYLKPSYKEGEKDEDQEESEYLEETIDRVVEEAHADIYDKLRDLKFKNGFLEQQVTDLKMSQNHTSETLLALFQHLNLEHYEQPRKIVVEKTKKAE